MVRAVGSVQDLTDSPGKNKSSKGTKNYPVGGNAARADTCHTLGLSHRNATMTVPRGPPGMPRMPRLPWCDSSPPSGLTCALSPSRTEATSGDLGNVFGLSGACGLCHSGSVKTPLVLTLNQGRPVKNSSHGPHSIPEGIPETRNYESA